MRKIDLFRTLSGIVVTRAALIRFCSSGPDEQVCSRAFLSVKSVHKSMP
jgi:hypothetical protein